MAATPRARHRPRPRRALAARPDRPARRRPLDPGAPARRDLEGRVRRRARWDSPGGLIVAGMGGSGIGGRIARGDPRRPGLAAGRSSVGGYALPPWTTAGRDRAVRELLGRHRGDARLLRGRRRAGRAADRRHHRRRRSRRPPAPRASPSCRWRAGCSRAPRSPTRRSPRSRRPRCAARARGSRPRSTSPPTTSSSSRSPGGRTPGRSARPRRSPARCTAPSP